ncbi:hypothetical protein PPL_07384 [Heterostelium album PN500]|uniref:Uncharacterized protein n=1 Tax=Heterostelium pallidum (strain ATCC 26659 / Pp 5 / PN500) TaxID=670386 RepID=D3BFT3_HETP5|nr:hypothetical protein PPL_07384 [Heterostelium album PN500]EFA79693.1 hypothetical protein PPL_07384 [Heterostelium album PN500]|eukprot:XP_020431814.1 hypothetical protein PPL_07384 [Heterostelium album PN500]
MIPRVFGVMSLISVDTRQQTTPAIIARIKQNAPSKWNGLDRVGPFTDSMSSSSSSSTTTLSFLVIIGQE